MTIPDTLITTYLEMTDINQFAPAYLDDTGWFEIKTMQTPDIEFYRFLYRAVGQAWRWRDRLTMPDDELESLLASSKVHVDVVYTEGVPAGYIELARTGAETEIAYFGLRSTYFGRGLGKHLLSHGVARAWKGGANRVWVHTCNLDGPNALKNYTRRGFRVYDVKEEPMPETYF